MDVEMLPAFHQIAPAAGRRRLIKITVGDVQDIRNQSTTARGICKPFRFVDWLAERRILAAEDVHSWTTIREDITLSLKEALDTDSSMTVVTFYYRCLTTINRMIDDEEVRKATEPAPVVIDPATFEWWW